MDICLRVLKKSKNSRFDVYCVRNSVLIISHVTFRDCRVQIFYDNLSQHSCILNYNEGYNGGFWQLKYCSLWAIRISYLLHNVQKAIGVVLRI